jgi:hypothetical protein
MPGLSALDITEPTTAAGAPGRAQARGCLMPAPAKAKVKLESIVGLKAIMPTTAEANNARQALRAVADDPEPSQDLKAEASTRAGRLELAISLGNEGAREVAMRSAIMFAAQNI